RPLAWIRLGRGLHQVGGGTGGRVVREPRVPRGPATRSERSERRERRGGCGERATLGAGAPSERSEPVTGPATEIAGADYGVIKWTGLPRMFTSQVVMSWPVPSVPYSIFHQPPPAPGGSPGETGAV